MKKQIKKMENILVKIEFHVFRSLVNVNVKYLKGEIVLIFER